VTRVLCLKYPGIRILNNIAVETSNVAVLFLCSKIYWLFSLQCCIYIYAGPSGRAV
jgi:hypothetical protein